MSRSAGVILAVLQLAFALTWVIYVIYLPALAAQAGIPREAVPWILLMDQAIFIVCDWAAGVYADRTAATLRRIGPPLALAAIASCTAFLLLPWIAPAASPVAFLLLTAAWSATSSALRAPPLTLVGRHAAKPGRPWLAGMYLLGLGIASALAPYLGVALKGVDPRIPFALSTAMVAVMTLMLVRAERRVAEAGSSGSGEVLATPPPSFAGIAAFAIAAALFAIGFQVHFSILSSPAYLRFAVPAQLEHLMPVFWIGFNLAVLPATLLAKRFSGGALMVTGGCLGTVLAGAVALAPGLPQLVGVQLAFGAAWGTVLVGAFTAALEVGRPGREGSATGLLFSMLAVAAFARIGFVTSGLPKSEQFAPILGGMPSLAWAAATLVLLMALWLRPAATPGPRRGPGEQ